MKYKKYPTQFWTQIKDTTKKLQDQGQQLVAAFDADGTLWDTDLGENFFHYTIDQRLVSLPQSAWNHYLEMKKVNNDPRSAYLWLAQIYKGQPLVQVQKWAEEALQSIQPLAVFPEQKELIDFLKSESVQIQIITASIKWAVEPGAKFLGLTSDDVIGVETHVRDQIVTDEQKGIITYKKGKVEALAQKIGKNPFLAAGNSEGDLDLLESSTHIKLAVSAANRDDKLFRTEHNLQQIAEQNKWLHHRFI